MKLTTAIILVGFALAAEAGTRDIRNPKARNGKFLSIINIVAFDNLECTGASNTAGNEVKGTCYSATECNDKGGAKDGTCASGFGVCCVFIKSGCTQTVSGNCTYIQNPGYPTSYSTTATTCTTTFSRPSKSEAGKLCMMRLDFQNVVTEYSTTDGSCSGTTGTTDAINVRAPFTSSTGAYPPTLCGTLTGQHIYFDVGDSGDPTLEIQTGTTTANRRWNIKSTWIECNNPSKPPGSCTQYYTGISGRVESFNWDNQQLIDNMDYKMCFRQELGYCSIQWNEVQGSSIDTFQLSPATSSQMACTRAALNINGLGQACGSVLSFTSIVGQTTGSAAITSVKPFNVGVLVEDGTASTGYYLQWTQLAC